MSAYVIEREHAGFLAAVMYSRAFFDGDFRYYWEGGWHKVDTIEGALAAGQELWDENARSVAARYKGIPVYQVLELKDVHVTAKKVPVDIIKAVHCYTYQACEHDGWKGSRAEAIGKAIINQAIRKLDGYAAAAWGAPAYYRER